MADDKTLREKILSSKDDSIFFRSDFPEYHTESVAIDEIATGLAELRKQGSI